MLQYIILNPKPAAAASGGGQSGNEGGAGGGAGGGPVQDQVPTARATLYRREQVELGYRGGPAGPGSGMFNMGNTCYLNSTLQVRQTLCAICFNTRP